MGVVCPLNRVVCGQFRSMHLESIKRGGERERKRETMLSEVCLGERNGEGIWRELRARFRDGRQTNVLPQMFCALLVLRMQVVKLEASPKTAGRKQVHGVGCPRPSPAAWHSPPPPSASGSCGSAR